jgi:hypothetical protein
MALKQAVNSSKGVSHEVNQVVMERKGKSVFFKYKKLEHLLMRSGFQVSEWSIDRLFSTGQTIH